MQLKGLQILFFIGLLKLPFFFDISLLNIPFALVFIGVFIISLNNGRLIPFLNPGNRRLFFPLLFYFILVWISFFRSDNFFIFDTIYFGAFHFFLIAYVSEILHWCKSENKSVIDGIRKYFINNFTILILLNLVLWSIGFKLSAKALEEVSLGTSVILASMGIVIERVNFLFSMGVNSYAVILGAVFTFLVTDSFLQRKFDLITLAKMAGVFFSILLTDSRGALAAPIVTLAFILFIRVFRLRVLIRLTPLIFIVVPIAIVLLLPMLSQMAFMAQFSRNNMDLFTMNGRIFVWFFASEEFLNFKPLHIIGYGYRGHYQSGASLNWAFVFATYANSEYVHPHNSILSILFDIGYLGLSTVLFVLHRISQSVVSFWKNFSANEALTLYSLLFYAIFISITESFITPYYLNAFTLFFGFCLFMFSIHPKATTENI